MYTETTHFTWFRKVNFQCFSCRQTSAPQVPLICILGPSKMAATLKYDLRANAF